MISVLSLSCLFRLIFILCLNLRSFFFFEIVAILIILLWLIFLLNQLYLMTAVRERSETLHYSGSSYSHLSLQLLRFTFINTVTCTNASVESRHRKSSICSSDHKSLPNWTISLCILGYFSSHALYCFNFKLWIPTLSDKKECWYYTKCSDNYGHYLFIVAMTISISYIAFF